MQVLVRDQHTCAECGSPLISHQGSLVCRECGLEHSRELVPGTCELGESIDYGNDYSASRSIKANNAAILIETDGLGTYISSSAKSTFRRADVLRLQRLNRRVVLGKLRGERKALRLLIRYCSLLDLPGHVVRRARYLCKQGMRRLRGVARCGAWSPNRILLSCCAAILATREARVAVDPQEIIDLWADSYRVPPSSVRKCFFWIRRHLNVTYLPLQPLDFVEKVVSRLASDDDLRERFSEEGLDLTQILQETRRNLTDIFSSISPHVYKGRKPSIMVPSCAYVLLKSQYSSVVTQRAVADACDVHIQTLREHSKMWRNFLERENSPVEMPADDGIGALKSTVERDDE